MPLLSIIIPVFNAQNLLPIALNSCLNQGLSDIEILIIEDKSYDESLRVGLEFMRKDTRIRLIQNDKNLGTFASRNRGILESNAPFFIFLDSDDFLESFACERALSAINMGFDIALFDAFVHRVRTKFFYRFKQNFVFERAEFLEFLTRQRHFCWSVWAKVFRKDIALKALKLVAWDLKMSYSEDMLFCYLYFMHCQKIGVFKESIYHYEFNERGRYESKEYLKQNYDDKRQCIELMQKLSTRFNADNFHQILWQRLEKESEDLRLRSLF